MSITTAYYNNLTRARSMLVQGYINHIICIETGIQLPTIRDLRKTMLEEGKISSIRDRSIRQSQTIIKKRTHAEEATLLMLAYRRLVGTDMASRGVVLDALEEAYDAYTLMRLEINTQAEISLTINDAYSLARDLRSDLAYFPTCECCGSQYFVAINQECMSRCPFCLTPEGQKEPLADRSAKRRKTIAA